MDELVTIISVSPTETTAYPGTRVKVAVVAKNNTFAYMECPVGIKIPGLRVHDVRFIELPPRSAKTVVFEFTIPRYAEPGTYAGCVSVYNVSRNIVVKIPGYPVDGEIDVSAETVKGMSLADPSPVARVEGTATVRYSDGSSKPYNGTVFVSVPGTEYRLEAVDGKFSGTIPLPARAGETEIKVYFPIYLIGEGKTKLVIKAFKVDVPPLTIDNIAVFRIDWNSTDFPSETPPVKDIRYNGTLTVTVDSKTRYTLVLSDLEARERVFSRTFEPGVKNVKIGMPEELVGRLLQLEVVMEQTTPYGGQSTWAEIIRFKILGHAETPTVPEIEVSRLEVQVPEKAPIGSNVPVTVTAVLDRKPSARGLYLAVVLKHSVLAESRIIDKKIIPLIPGQREYTASSSFKMTEPEGIHYVSAQAYITDETGRQVLSSVKEALAVVKAVKSAQPKGEEQKEEPGKEREEAPVPARDHKKLFVILGLLAGAGYLLYDIIKEGRRERRL